MAEDKSAIFANADEVQQTVPAEAETELAESGERQSDTVVAAEALGSTSVAAEVRIGKTTYKQATTHFINPAM